MGSVVKKSVSYDPEVYQAVAAEAEANHMSVSAALNEGARLWLGQRRGLRAVEQWERENGQLTAAELAEADALLTARSAQES